MVCLVCGRYRWYGAGGRSGKALWPLGALCCGGGPESEELDRSVNRV